jgi:DNA-binding transcriptional ArsR family regulator
VSDRREGRWAYYSLNAEALEAMGAYLEESKPEAHAAGCGCRGCC